MFVPTVASAQLSEGLLFKEPDSLPRATELLRDDPTIVRYRYVDFNPRARPTATTLRDSPVTMNFFDDTYLEIVLESITTPQKGRFVWTGYVFGEPETSSVTLAGNSDVLVGNIRTDDVYFQIRVSPDGIPMVAQIDETKYPECGTTLEHAIHPQDYSFRSIGPRIDLPDLFDILVVYTPSARAAEGGTAAMESLIDLAISETNAIYANSLINSQVRLVHQMEIDYQEAGYGVDLGRLRFDGEGYMDEVHDYRDQLGADQVVLLINDPAYCGLANQMTSLSAGFESHAFSVVYYLCAAGYFSFAHELGHNQGAHHASGDATGNGLLPQGAGLYNYSHGWRWMGTNGSTFRSVMAYTPGIRKEYFSNPNVHYMGAATGRALGEPDEAYNALGINNAAETVANWRSQVNGLAVTPGVPYSTVFDYGETLSSTAFAYTLHNVSDIALNWTASSTESWATLSPSSGILAPYETLEIAIELNSMADALVPGSYATVITINDTTNAISHDRDVSFSITRPMRMLMTLDSDPGWSTTGDWAFGVPEGFGSEPRDPTSGYTGSNVYGYNLSGDYAPNMSEETLTTPAFDLTGFSRIQLSFYRWLGVATGNLDHARIQVSVDNSTWIDIWENPARAIADDPWSEQIYDVPDIADDQSTVYFRWVMGTSDQSVQYPGWNIDDIAIRGLLDDSILSEVWVDFDGDLTGLGTPSNPFNELGEAVNAVTGSGTIRIKGDSADTDTGETLTISKPMTIHSSNGIVQIGATP